MNMLDKNKKKSGNWLRTLLPVFFVCAGLLGGYYYVSRQPDIKRKPPVKQAVMVETLSLSPGNYQGSIHAMGTVMPDREVMLKANVSGEVVFSSPGFVQGGLLKKGELLLVIDDADYKIELEKAQSAFEKAVSNLAIEQGSQLIAKEELKLINEVSSEIIEATDLALRKPQLIQAQAAVKTARADLEKAKLNISRTKIRVPFNALVIEKSIEKGSLVNSQGVLCTLVDIDFFQVETQVAPDRLSFFSIHETKGSKAQIYSRYSEQTWPGKVVRSTGKISDRSRMAGVIVKVPDPFGFLQGQSISPLLLGDHVDVKIMGNIFNNVYVLSRNLLREDQTVWVYDNGVLDIRKITIAWKENGQVFVSSGITPEDQLIVSDLAAPVRGMALQIKSDQITSDQIKLDWAKPEKTQSDKSGTGMNTPGKGT